MTTTKTGHPRSISELLDASLNGAATFRTKATRAPWQSAEPVSAAPVAPAERPEPYLSKRALAGHYEMSVRWVEQKIAVGLPVADYMDGRPRLRLGEAEPWLRENGHLSAERPKAPRPGTTAVS
jgi:hypothetical protein